MACRPLAPVIVVLLALLVGVVTAGAGFGFWAYMKAEERRKDMIRIEQIDREIKVVLATEEDRPTRIRRMNELMAEQNPLVRKYPELNRAEQQMIPPPQD